MNTPFGGYWDCHVCGRPRPDGKVSVHKVHGTLGPGGRFEITANVRHCNDETICTEGAQLVGEGWLKDVGAALV